MVPRPNAEALDQARQNHIGRLLHRAARAFNDLALEKLHAQGHTNLSLSHTNVLPHLEIEGTRIVTLAERAGMTKQGAGQLVVELEAHGYLERRPDPIDGRATRIFFTEAGWQYLLDAQKIKQAIEAKYRTALGEDSWRELNSALTRLLQLDKQ